MFSFVMGLIIGYLAYQTALLVVGYTASTSADIEIYLRRLLSWTYSMIVGVFMAHLAFGSAAWPIVGFALSHAITLCLIDFEDTYESLEDL